MDSIRCLRSYLSLLFSCSLESNGYVFVSSSSLIVFPTLSFCFIKYLFILAGYHGDDIKELFVLRRPELVLRAIQISTFLQAFYLSLFCLAFAGDVIGEYPRHHLPLSYSIHHFSRPLLRSPFESHNSFGFIDSPPLLPILLHPFYLILLISPASVSWLVFIITVLPPFISVGIFLPQIYPVSITKQIKNSSASRSWVRFPRVSFFYFFFFFFF